MKMNIFLFEDLKSQDFLDPDFSDTHIWVQTSLAHVFVCGAIHNLKIVDSPTLKGPVPTYMCHKKLDP